MDSLRQPMLIHVILRRIWATTALAVRHTKLSIIDLQKKKKYNMRDLVNFLNMFQALIGKFCLRLYTYYLSYFQEIKISIYIQKVLFQKLKGYKGESFLCKNLAKRSRLVNTVEALFKMLEKS